MKKGLLFAAAIALLLLMQPAMSAPLRNVPQKLMQPDGVTLECLASGDEHFNWLHDENGYVIIQDQSTGYYTYAVSVNGDLQPSQYIAGRVDPASVGLVPDIKPSPEKMQQILAASESMLAEAPPAAAPTTGTINNIVVFIRFAGESEFTDQISTYDGMFNSAVSGANSLLNYFKETSYNTLNVSTTFYPPPPGATVVSYQDPVNTRGYYQPYNASTNPIGYQGGDNGSERTSREHILLKNAVDAIASQVPAGLNVDGDGDGNVDNVCFIIDGSPTGWASLLWPHKWSLYSQSAYINGKQVYTYNFQLQTSTLSSGVGVLCHEMMHSLGAPDLYHYSYDGFSPVGSWDIMEYDANPPQHSGAYMKYRYGHWISSIPTISTPGIYTLNPLTSATNNCYKIASVNSSTEYYVVEYRKKGGTFENSVPGSGLVVYRINTARDGQGNASGPPDEIYVYRPNGTCSANGSYGTANFSSDVGRTAINDMTNPAPFLPTCGAGGLSISEVGTCGSTISFRVAAGGTDSYEPDNTCDVAKTIQSGVPQTHSIYPATDVDWMKFTLTQSSSVTLETSGASGNTRMWLYSDCGGTLVEYNDDGNGLFSRIDRLCGVDPLPGGTYYVKIDESGNDHEIASYTISMTADECGWVCSTDVPKTIADLSTVWSDLPVTGTDLVADVNVKLSITHTYDADLDVYLQHPDGTLVELFTAVGGSGDNFTNTVLDDEASISIASGVAAFTGSYRPAGLLSALDGKPVAGTWRLKVTDTAGGDTGVLQSWCLLITAPAGPIVTNVTSATANGCYGAGAPVGIQVTFSEAVNVTGSPQLELETGTVDRMATYSSGSGTNTLTFTYTVQSGDTAPDLCYKTIASLMLNGGTIKNSSDVSANLTLATPGAIGSLSYNKAIVIDTPPPTVTSVNRSNPSGQSTKLQNVVWRVTFNEAVTGVATVTPWDFALRVVSGPISGYHIDSVSAVSSTVYDVTVDTGSGDGEFALDVPASATIYDCANNDYNSDYTAGQTYKIDRTAPQVTVTPGVTSSTANGSYNVPDVISIQATFSEAVSVTGGPPQLELETGAIDRKADYSSGSGGSTLTFTYTVQAGDTSSDLDYTGAGALALNGGTIRDAAGNDASLTLPAPGAAGSLGYNKDFVIDTAAPLVPSKPDLNALDDTGESDIDDCTRNTTGLTLCGTAEIGATVKLWEGATLLGSGPATGGNYCIDVSLLGGAYNVIATATDAGGNESAASAGLAITIDTTPPVSSAGPLDCGYTAAVIDVPCDATDVVGCGVWHLDLWYRQRPLSGGAWSAWANYGTLPACPGQFDSGTVGGDGEYEFYTIAVDKAGNTETAPPAADCVTKVLADGLAAPVLNPEPASTPGSTNEISWISTDPATLFQAQCSQGAGFGSVEQDTGWQSRPPDCYTFSGLQSGTDHWFRVRSGIELCPTAFGTWSQTSQADWDTGTKTNVSTSTSPGDVVLEGSAGLPVSDTVGDTTSPSTGSLRGRFDAYQCTTSRILTQIEVYLNIPVSTTIQYAVYESNVQLGTNAYSLKYSNTVETSGTGQQFYSSGPISVSLIAGKYYLIGAAWSGSTTYYMGGTNTSVAFGQSFGYTSSTYPPPATLTAYPGASLYHHRLTSVGSGYTSAGTITSAAIAPSPFVKWGVLSYTKDTLPAGTALSVDVLDGVSEVALLTDVGSGTDLDAAGLASFPVKLRANLSTTNTANTPKLSDWAVSYTKSEQTVIPSDWSNVESSSQFPVYGLPNRSVGDAIIASVLGQMAFTVWGRVTVIDEDSFDLDDGSGPIHVVAPGYSLQNGSYASATGILDVSRTLTSEARLVHSIAPPGP